MTACPCGNPVDENTVTWAIPLCCGCYEDMGCPGVEPRCMPFLRHLIENGGMGVAITLKLEGP